MNVRVSRVVLLVLSVYLSFACAQNTFSITLDSRRGGTIPAEEIEHHYLLDLPAGVPQVTIRVDAFGDDADMAVYYGDEELYYSIDIDPYPTVTLRNPSAGRYDIYVLNLLAQPLAYEVYVETAHVSVPPTRPADPPPVRVTPPDSVPSPVPSPVPTVPPLADGVCPENMTAYRGGSSALSCTCTAQASQAEGRLWGDGVYTDDSNVCLAARHAGVISSQGGTVTVYPAPGQASYTGSTSNGVTSGSWGSWAGSFAFTRQPAHTPQPMPPVTPQPPAPMTPPAGDLVRTPTLPVTSSQGATLQSSDGVVLEIPAGAVPRTVTGEVGEMVFSIEPTTVTGDVLPSGFASAGAAFHVGPAGLPLEQPVTLTLPIDPSVDPQTVVGAATFDGTEWVVVPGQVDAAARTVSVSTDHLSPWLAIGMPTGWRQDDPRLAQVGGWLSITNGDDPSLLSCPRDDNRCNTLPWKDAYGVCLVDYTLVDPNQRFWSRNVRDASRTAFAAQGETIRWWLPNGTYVIEALVNTSQYNNIDPLYVPRYRQFVAPQRTITISNGNVVSVSEPGRYQEGFSVCFGGQGAGSSREEITSVGTGDIQVTLTWQADVDVDLYVTDPNGETIYYGNASSRSGGELDRDNRCSNLEWGRPENIFWDSNPPTGSYQIDVDYYGACGDGDSAVNWNVRTVVNGVSRTYTGTLNPFDRQQVATFTIP